MTFLRTLRSALVLCLLLRPRGDVRGQTATQFWQVALLLTLAQVGYDYATTEAPRQFLADGIRGVATDLMLSALAAWIVTNALRRPVLLWPLGTYAFLIGSVLAYVVAGLRDQVLDPAWPELAAQWPLWSFWLWAAWMTLALRRWFDWVEPWRPWPRRSAAAMLVAAILGAPSLVLYPSSFFYTLPDTGEAEAVADTAPAFVAEEVMADQHTRVDAAVERMRPGVPGEIELFVVAFGGDGGEDVFRNEVAYAQALFGQRFHARGRVLSLVNNPSATEFHPLATLTNLRRGLLRIATRMNLGEDMLLLFLTSHGSPDHQLHVALEPLPLQQIQPQHLREALDQAGIRWRAVIVSACYSGGFIPALADAQTLVMTAARADRTSFGCGVKSDITYFGRALFAEALNDTGDLNLAFALAARNVAQRERADDAIPSEPQIQPSAAFTQRWQQWLAAHPPGPPVAFVAPEDPSAEDPGGEDPDAEGEAEDGITAGTP